LDQTTPRRSFKKKIFQELGILGRNDLCSPKILVEGEKKEQEAATKIVVASSFCRRSFESEANLHQKTRVISYGLSASFLLAGHERDYSKPRERLRFLYVGNLGWHKGIKILLQAWSSILLSGASLRVVGRGSDIVEDELWRAGIELVGQLDTAGVAKEMSEADVLLFPSFFEGFGRVILEGMAAGLPVIASRNTGGPDVIEEGKEGFIVPAGDAEALREKMEWAVRNQEKVAEMGRVAYLKAKRFTWENYGEQYSKLLLSISDSPPDN
jgi:glycosyltransferase involved in cell wall biosynthesis